MTGRDDELSGIRGWLLLFFLTLVVFQPLFLIYRLLVSLGATADTVVSAGWPSYIIAVRILLFVILIASWLLAARLWLVRNWITIRIVIGAIWMINLGASLYDLTAMITLLGADTSSALGATVSEIFRGLVYCLLWTAYLLRSRRVANTYRRHGDNDHLAAVFD